MKIYIPSISGRPIQWVFDRGVAVSYGFTFLGLTFIAYHIYK